MLIQFTEIAAAANINMRFPTEALNWPCSFCFALRVGTVGVYDKGRRVWRVKTKYEVRSAY